MVSALPPAPLESKNVPKPNIGMTTPSFNVIVEDNPVGICTSDDMTDDVPRKKING